MRKKKVIIVGAGITGLLSAFFLQKKKIQVEIFETKKKPGGINGDFISGEKRYISGCQYFENSFWFKLLPKQLKNDFYKTKVNYYSYCDIFDNKDKVTKNYPDLTVDKKIDLNLEKYKSFKKCQNLFDRCFLYPRNISLKLYEWVSRYNLNEKNMIKDSHKNGLMFARIYLKKNKNLKKLKKKSDFFDYIYGIPRKEKLNGLLPKNGYDYFFESFSNYLIKKGVKINYTSPVRPKWKRKKLEIYSKNNLQKNDYIIWTGNPTSLVKEYSSKLLDSANISIKIFTFPVKGKINKPFYVQSYAKKSSILRMFFYKIRNENMCAIECFNEEESSKKICKDANKILKLLKFKIKLINLLKHQTIQKRYSTLTHTDKFLLNDLKKYATNTNLIPWPWELYSREGKILKINNLIKHI